MHPDRPPITILMPCRDAKASFIREALASVRAQTDPGWRLLVIDDRTTLAETREVLVELERSEDPRISVVPSEGRHVTAAFNTGMRRAGTPYVCSLHCDDLLEPGAIEALVRAIEAHPRTDYFHSARRIIDANGDPLSAVLGPVERIALGRFKDQGQVRPLHCWKVEPALAIGGMDESLGPHGGDDYDFPWCLAEAGRTFTAVRECLYRVRDHREHFRLTTHVPLDRQVAELKKIWRKHGVNEDEIARQVAKRTAGYLRQALYEDDEDRERKEAAGFDPRTGWKESYD